MTTHRVFCAGDIVAHAGDMGQEMFFLERGTVEVLSADRSTVFATLNEGSFFGETSVRDIKTLPKFMFFSA